VSGFSPMICTSTVKPRSDLITPTYAPGGCCGVVGADAAAGVAGALAGADCGVGAGVGAAAGGGAGLVGFIGCSSFAVSS
jgi:hypothetical protein